ncbi:MAG: transketolase [Desulfobulbaceae bacterium]|nr:transketolase [Desulfobulbaceae bacterium]
MDRKLRGYLEGMSRQVRRDVLRMHCKGTNVASAMSAVDILVGLYFAVMPRAQDGAAVQDRFILSKGHGVAALYATLAARGLIESALLATYLHDGSPLAGHPARGSLPGIETSTGSLGHGLPMAVGLAWAAKLSGSPARVFVMQGDGEQQEGSVWEAAALAARLELGNLVVIVDINGLQGYDRVNDLTPLGLFADKWQAFGWQTQEIDGHEHEQIAGALNACPLSPARPTAILARTVKGKGVGEMEDQLGWHYFSVPPEKLEAFVRELDER